MPAATYFMGVWKRTHELYEYEIESFPKTRWTKEFYSHFNSLTEYIIECCGCSKYLQSIKNGTRLNTYDIQMIYLSYKHNMYSIYPNINMVSNIGLDGGANNHVSKEDPFYQRFANRPRYEIDIITHPEYLQVDKKFEKSFYNVRRLRGSRPFLQALRSIKSLIIR